MCGWKQLMNNCLEHDFSGLGWNESCFKEEHQDSVSGEDETFHPNDTFEPNPMRFAAIFVWLFTFHPLKSLILSSRLSFRWTPGQETMFYITHI